MGSPLVAAESVNSGANLNRIPDVLLPSQFFESVGTRTMSSEQRLMLAILVDAVNVLADIESGKIVTSATISTRHRLGSLPTALQSRCHSIKCATPLG
jgi:hypothetical protein